MMKGLLLIAIMTAMAENQTIGLRKTASFSVGATSNYTRVKVIDANHNGKNDIIFTGTRPAFGAVFFYEHEFYDTYCLRDSIVGCSLGLFYDIGSLDGDSLTDAVMQCNLTGTGSEAVVFESPDYYSYPTQIVWQWRYEFNGGGTNPSIIADLDRDGKMDFLTIDCYVIYIFENTGNNQYQKVYWDTLRDNSAIGAVGDYDQDGKVDFVTATPLGWVSVYECIAGDQYAEVFLDTLPEPAPYDLWSGNDLDGDGKPEFLISSHRWPYGYHLFVFEAIGDNNYEYTIVDSIVSKGGEKLKLGGHSSCGDVDSDGRDEIVWAIADRFSVYKATGHNQYQMIYRSPRRRYTSTHAVAYDINKNGYAEIIESACIDSPYVRTETTIWEIEGVRLHRPNGGEVLTPGSQFPITWEKFTPPGADSFTLFISFDNGVNYQTITTIQQSNDTLYMWSVPDTLSDSCKIMIWAYGPPRAGEDKPRGTAWDFSDSIFAIRQLAVGEVARYRIHDAGLKISPNPFVVFATVQGHEKEQFTVYDICGKKVGTYRGDRIGIDLNAGVYFVYGLSEKTTDFKPVRIVKIK